MDMDILRYPDAKWNISGLFSHDAVILKFWDILWLCQVFPICGVHGSVPCKWNSGRTVIRHSDRYIEECIQEYNKRNIPLILTFSNYYLSENDLLDDFSNHLLDLISRYPNSGAIVASPLLADYIRIKYPKLQLTMSVLASVNTDVKRDKNYYEESASKYSRVVIHPDDSIDTALLADINPKDSFEIMVNENCIRDCSFRRAHDNLVCIYSIEGTDELFNALADFSREKCQMFIKENNLLQYLTGKVSCCNFSYEHLDKIYKMGFRYYKLQGRADAPASFLYDLTKYILTESAGTYIYKYICNMISFTEVKDSLTLL